MRLNESNKKNYLMAEIQNYYDDEERLKSIFRINQEIFGTNFYGSIGGNDFETRIINLVREIINRDKLNDFIKIIRNTYPLFAQKLPEISSDELIMILNQLDIQTHKTVFLQAYQLSVSKRMITDLTKNIENVEKLIDYLDDIPQTEQDSPIQKFVGYLYLLAEKNKIDLSVIQRDLSKWIERYCLDFKQLITRLEQEEQQCNPGLMVAISISGENYVLEAWLIKNLAQYDRKSFSDCEQLKIDNKVQISINKTLDNLPQLIRNLICESSVSIKKIQIFLPIELMNHPVDCWKMYENEDEYETIGETYPICIRCSEGLRGKNPRLMAWRDKGRLISDKLAQTAADIFIVGDNKEVKTLEKQLRKENAIAAKIVPVFQNNLPGEILWKAGVPLALWVRQELPDIENIVILDELINDGCLEELPERVKMKRLDAMDQNPPENHVGRHLCLLWDDPNFLPPEQLLAENQL